VTGNTLDGQGRGEDEELHLALGEGTKGGGDTGLEDGYGEGAAHITCMLSVLSGLHDQYLPRSITAGAVATGFS
jgi:hypothetical protein